MTKMHIPTLAQISDSTPIVPSDNSPDEPRIRIKRGCLTLLLSRETPEYLEHYTFDNELGDVSVEVGSVATEIVSISISGISSLQRESDWRRLVDYCWSDDPSDTSPDDPSDTSPFTKQANDGTTMGGDDDASDTSPDASSDT